MLDLSKYPKKVFTEESAKKEAANIAASWAIEGMTISEEEQQLMVDYFMGRLTQEEFDSKYLKLD